MWRWITWVNLVFHAEIINTIKTGIGIGIGIGIFPNIGLGIGIGFKQALLELVLVLEIFCSGLLVMVLAKGPKVKEKTNPQHYRTYRLRD